MKITDFGLWFRTTLDKFSWFTDIPQRDPSESFEIWYDGEPLGWQNRYLNNTLSVFHNTKYIIKMKDPRFTNHFNEYRIGRSLTLTDFEIIPNPDHQEQK